MEFYETKPRVRAKSRTHENDVIDSCLLVVEGERCLVDPARISDVAARCLQLLGALWCCVCARV